MHNITLVQESNEQRTRFNDLAFGTLESNLSNPPDEIEEGKAQINLIIANTTLKYSQSNSVASAAGGQTLGVGAGQQSRVDCVKLAKRKTQQWIFVPCDSQYCLARQPCRPGVRRRARQRLPELPAPLQRLCRPA